MGLFRRRQAFTLVELMVVLAIIAILIALIIPALQSVWTSAHLVVCQSNLKQIYTASASYAYDNDGYLPDEKELGGYWFRREPGTKPDDEPFALEERFGLAATLDRGGYLDGSSEVWVCPAQPHWMAELGNTYAFSCPSERINNTPISMLGRTPWVYDNYFALPYTSGFRGGPGPGWLIPPEKRQPPHPIVRKEDEESFGADGANTVYADGSVEVRKFR
jgi:prepilin-type N-terminal cleavage/methylation domain-containing protein/prepilin-type processing-associated H-X9-DG protein